MQDALPDNFGSPKSSVYYCWSIPGRFAFVTRPELGSVSVRQARGVIDRSSARPLAGISLRSVSLVRYECV